MARRGGKAASRRSRQKKAQRAAQAPAPRPVASPAPEPAPPVTPAPPTDAFEAADAELRASTPPPGMRAGSRPAAASVRARTGDFHMTAGPSRLSERAAAEYGYVGRDLRNIAVLVVVMAVLLALSAVLFNVLGIGRL